MKNLGSLQFLFIIGSLWGGGVGYVGVYSFLLLLSAMTISIDSSIGYFQVPKTPLSFKMRQSAEPFL